MRGFIKGGEEHRVRPGDDIFHKATHPGKYGFTVILVNGQPTPTHALPIEYLERLLLANQTFDAHPANFLRDRNGVILPIDAVLLQTDDELGSALEALL